MTITIFAALGFEHSVSDSSSSGSGRLEVVVVGGGGSSRHCPMLP